MRLEQLFSGSGVELGAIDDLRFARNIVINEIKSNDSLFNLYSTPAMLKYLLIGNTILDSSCGKIIAEQKLIELKQKIATHGQTQAIQTQLDVDLCLTLLFYLIKCTPHESNEGRDDFSLLMNLPIVHRYLSEYPCAGAYELYQMASDRNRNNSAAEALRLLPTVQQSTSQQAQRARQQGRRIEDDQAFAWTSRAESSMLPLSSKEEAALEKLCTTYQSTIEGMGGMERSFENMLKTLQQRYQTNPATLELLPGEKPIALPLTWAEFKKLKLTAEQSKLALAQYYQHPTHTVIRYFSQPNDWIDPNAAHSNREARCARFHAYKPIFVYSWFAANDTRPEAAATDGFTVEQRVAEWIKTLSHDLARAHNWDSKTEKRMVEGKLLSFALDDERADNPSCEGGTKRRAFSLLQWHPLSYTEPSFRLQEQLRTKVREQMLSQFQCTDTGLLETILAEYKQLTLGEKSEQLLKHSQTWDLPQEMTEPLIAKWTSTFGDELVKCEIGSRLTRTETKSHFLTFVQEFGLDNLILNVLASRADHLKKSIETDTSTALIERLSQDDPISSGPLLVRAIHLGLLKTIADRLSEDEFATLLGLKDERYTAYAPVLALYENEEKLLEGWLKKLSPSDCETLLAEIRSYKEVTVCSPEESFETLLKTHCDSEAGFRDLNLLYLSLKASDNPSANPLAKLSAARSAELIKEAVQTWCNQDKPCASEALTQLLQHPYCEGIHYHATPVGSYDTLPSERDRLFPELVDSRLVLPRLLHAYPTVSENMLIYSYEICKKRMSTLDTEVKKENCFKVALTLNLFHDPQPYSNYRRGIMDARPSKKAFLQEAWIWMDCTPHFDDREALKKELLDMAHRHFKRNHAPLRILADLLMMILFPIGCVVAAIKYQQTGSAFFYFWQKNEKTQRELDFIGSCSKTRIVDTP